MDSAIGSSIVEGSNGNADGSQEEAINVCAVQQNATDDLGEDTTNARVSETRRSKEESDENEKVDDNDPEVGCGVWSVGNPCADRVAVLAGLDRLGPFVLESYDRGLPLIDPDCDPFESEDGDQGEVNEDDSKATDCDIAGLKSNENDVTGLPLGYDNDVTGLDVLDEVTGTLLGERHGSIELSADVRELCLEDSQRSPDSDRDLKELVLNDLIEDKDDGSVSEFASSESIEQISDGVFQLRGNEEREEEIDRQPSKRKRKDIGRRSNFVKYRLHRKRRRYPHKRPKIHVKPPTVRSVTQAAV